MKEDKAKWVQAIKDLLILDRRSYVQDLEYEKPRLGLEIVTVTFLDGSKSMINVTSNSQGAILHEVIRETYGEGAYGHVTEKWW